SSPFLKEAGRIRDEKIVCSTALGRTNLPNEKLPKPDFIGADGVKVYQDLPPFRLPNAAVTSLQANDSYVTLNPFVFIQQDEGLHFKTTVIDKPQSQSHAASPSQPPSNLPAHPNQVLLPPGLLTSDNDFRIRDVLYSTRCSLLYNTCMTASLSVSEALALNRGMLKVLIFSGALVGGLLGLLLSFLYRRNSSMEQQLRRAIRKDQLQVVYQPIVDLPDGRIVGAEALARWTDEEGFVVGPDTFIRIAEQHGFVNSITELVFRHALRDFANMLRDRPGFHLSINVAASDLADPGFLHMLDSMLKRFGVEAKSLAIEITESSTALREVAIETIRRLRDRGCSVHIDDFGTGYSSLSYLRELAVDTIKIDKSFTQSIGTNAVTVAILPQILAMAAALNLRVIAEGIETGEQAQYFTKAGNAILAQGWLFGRAVPVNDFENLLTAQLESVSPAGQDAPLPEPARAL
ncbi:MAG: EAL domain-containing protein, partial [Terracidiphilus sp.]